MSSLLIRICVFLAPSCWGNDVASCDRNRRSSPSTVPRLEKLLERSHMELDEKRLEAKFVTPHWQQSTRCYYAAQVPHGFTPLNRRSLQTVSARFWLKKLLAQVHATQNIYLHNIVGTCTKEGLNKENTTQIAKYKEHSDLIP